MDFGKELDKYTADALAVMLGGIQVVPPVKDALLPPFPDCVELGDTTVAGGVRTQNYDCAYRPDGPRFVYDGKTLNDKDSIQKNWHNMVNDLATEATTVHARFPYAVVSFLVALPKDAAMAIPNQLENIITTLQRMNCRDEVNDEDFKAESIALVIWDPHTGEIDPSSPLPSSNLRVEKYTSKIEKPMSSDTTA
jgi:hypothetical protein